MLGQAASPRSGLPRAILYARVSTGKESQATSAVRQLSELREVAKSRRWQVVAKYTDRLSGGYERPGLTAALEIIFRAGADVLVVHDLDRLGRDVVSMLHNVDAIHAAGGNFFIRDRNIDTSNPEGRLTFTIFAALAEFQRRANRERIVAGLAFARKKGVRLGRPPTMPPAALERAVALRRKRPRPSWLAIARALEAAKLGTYRRTSIATSVTRCLKSGSKSASGGSRKQGVGRRRAG